MQSTLRRRVLMAGSLAALAAPALASLTASASPSGNAAAEPSETPNAEPSAASTTQAADEPPIVDTHQHLWDLEKVRLSWLNGAGALNRSYVMKDYREATAGLGVVKAVYMEVDVDTAWLDAEADYVVDICRRGDTPTCAAVIGGRPADPTFRGYITRFKGSPYVKGIRQIPPGTPAPGALYGEKAFVEGVHLLGELGMSFDICLSPPGVGEAARLVDACPGVRFILDHCGNADVKWVQAARKEPAGEAAKSLDQWRRGIETMAKRKSVVCKISGIIASVPKTGWGPEDLSPIVNHCLDSFGPDRVMFAGDWPVCTQGAPYRVWVQTLRQIVRERSLAERRKLWGDNAIAFYGLPK